MTTSEVARIRRPGKKKAARKNGRKSREETPKEAAIDDLSSITQRNIMRHCTIRKCKKRSAALQNPGLLTNHLAKGATEPSFAVLRVDHSRMWHRYHDRQIAAVFPNR